MCLLRLPNKHLNIWFTTQAFIASEFVSPSLFALFLFSHCSTHPSVSRPKRRHIFDRNSYYGMEITGLSVIPKGRDYK